MFPISRFLCLSITKVVNLSEESKMALSLFSGSRDVIELGMLLNSSTIQNCRLFSPRKQFLVIILSGTVALFFLYQMSIFASIN